MGRWASWPARPGPAPSMPRWPRRGNTRAPGPLEMVLRARRPGPPDRRGAGDDRRPARRRSQGVRDLGRRRRDRGQRPAHLAAADGAAPRAGVEGPLRSPVQEDQGVPAAGGGVRPPRRVRPGVPLPGRASAGQQRRELPHHPGPGLPHEGRGEGPAQGQEYEAAKDTVLAGSRPSAALPDGDAEVYFPIAELATIQAEAGDIPGALRTAESVSGGSWRVQVLGEVAGGLCPARPGATRPARQSPARSTPPVACPMTLSGRSIKRSTTMPSPRRAMDPMLPVLGPTARAQRGPTTSTGALQTVSRMGSSMWASYYREQAIGPIVTARLDAGDVPGARKAAETLPPRSSPPRGPLRS